MMSGSRATSTGWSAVRWSRRCTHCWMPRRTGCAMGRRRERTEARRETGACHCERPADQGWRDRAARTEATSADLETAIIERYRRRESSVEQALIEMYLPGSGYIVSSTSPRRCGGTRVFRGTPAAPSSEQSTRAHSAARDRAAHPRGRRIPRRAVSAQSRRGQACRYSVVDQSTGRLLQLPALA
jgi:hypothetical protein